jgi:hypothetical protein
MSRNPLNNLCRPNGPAGGSSTPALDAFVAAVLALEEVVAAYAREEVPMPPCSVCGLSYSWHWPCEQAHPGLCHDCARLNWGQAQLDNPIHPEPPEDPALTLTPRDVQALGAYRARVRRLREDDDDL